MRRLLKNALGGNAEKEQVLPAPPGLADCAFLARIAPGVHQSGKIKFGGMNLVGPNAHLAHGVEMGYATTISEDCWLRGPITMGNYCQLGPRVCLMAADHNLRHVTAYSSTALFGGALKAHTVPAPINLGHSVWIGYGAIVLRGVQIGNGAAIGAGAVVTKDVPAFHIAVGNPARVIKARFAEEFCELIERSRWWDRSSRELEPWRELFDLDAAEEPARVRELLEKMIAALPASASA